MRPRMVIRADAHLLACRHVFSRCFLLTTVSEERHVISRSCYCHNPGSQRAEVLQCPRTLSPSPCRLTSQLFLLWRSWRRVVPLVRLVLALRDQVRNRVSSWIENRVSKYSEEVQDITRRLCTNLPLFWIWHLGIRLQEHTEHIDMPKENCFGGCIIYLHFRCEVSDRH